MAEDRGRQLPPPEQFGGFEGSPEGLRMGEALLGDPAVSKGVEGNRGALVAALAAGLAALAIPQEGNAGAGTLVSGSGNEIVEWPDIETTEPNAAPTRRVVLPGVEGVNVVAATNDDKVVAVASGDGWDSRRIFVIEDIDGELSITNEVPVPEMTGLFGYPEATPDGQVLIPNGDTLWRFNPADGTVVPILDGNGEQLITSAESFTDGEGEVNALAIGQTPGSDADYLYHICRQGGEDVVTSYSFGTGSWESPYGPRITNVELSDSKLVFSDPGGTVVSVDFDESDISSLGSSLEAPTTIMGSVDIESAIRYAGHNDTGYYAIPEQNGTWHSFGTDGSARDILDVGDDILEVVPAGGDTYLVRTGEGIVEINGATQEVVRTVPGVGGSVNAVVTGDPEVAALLYAPVYNGVHVAADSAYEVTESAEPDTVEVALDVEEFIESGEPAEFSSLTVDATTFEHTIIINFGFDDIVLTGFGTAVKVTVSIVDGRVKLTAKVLKDGRLGNSSASLNGGDPIHEHPDSSAGETETQTIDLGPVEDFFTETGDDDDTGGQTDDDDANQLDDDDDDVPGGCADAGCDEAGAGSSDGAPFVAGGILGGGILWARRRRGNKAA